MPAQPMWGPCAVTSGAGAGITVTVRVTLQLSSVIVTVYTVGTAGHTSGFGLEAPRFGSAGTEAHR